MKKHLATLGHRTAFNTKELLSNLAPQAYLW